MSNNINIELVPMNNQPSEIKQDAQGDYKVFVDGKELMRLFLTCHFCPEQYELRTLSDNKYIAYFRLRCSNFTCEYYADRDENDIWGECIYQAEIGRSGFDGTFKNEKERMKHLTKAIELVVGKLRREKNE